MNRLDLTRPTAAENLALDEALLDQVVQVGSTLRFWEPIDWAVILGRASRVSDEVDQVYCRHASIPVLRRCSGGATVVTGPGCLMYAVTLSTAKHPQLTEVDRAHAFVLGRIRTALASLELDVQLAGSSDLIWQGRKFSGNSLRCKRDGLLYHGTLLYDADLDQISRCLKMPPKQPDYRRQRPHRDFLTNLPTTAEVMRNALAAAWVADDRLAAWPRQQTDQLVSDRYALDSWNFQR